MDQVVIAKITDWHPLARRLIDECERQARGEGRAVPVVLTGDLGAGKTTFSQVVAETLGVTIAVQSPTFTIMKSYRTNHPLFHHFIHMDAYRIETEAELIPLRFSELLAMPGALIFIEWGERIEKVLPLGTLHVTINHQNDDIRLVTIERK